MKLLVVALLAITLVSVKDEIALGRQADAQYRKQAHEVRDPVVRRYVAALGRTLAAAAPGPKYPYSFSVADTRELNAFSLPGGPVWVNAGLLAAATNESQVAGVLAHEVAHVAQRHAAAQFTETVVARWGLQFLGAMLGNVGGAAAAQRMASLLAGGAFLKFSRDDEREADRVGVTIVSRAGWDPRGLVELLGILRRQQRTDPDAVQVFLSTHPSPQERIADLEALVAHRPGGRRDSAEFQAVRARLRHNR